jgi:hypothetical protein
VSSTQVSTRVQSLTRRRVRTAIAIAVCAPVLAACSATGFGSPVRHAVANLQAASAKIGANLEVQGVIVALPSGTISPKGGLAYLQFNAINFASQPDALIDVSVEPATPSSAAPTASAPPIAEQLQAATDASIPAATGSGPGTTRISVLLRNLTAPLQQGDTVSVTLTFGNSGSVTGLLVPVQGAAFVGTFLPTAPPPPPSSPVASPVASPVGSPVESPAAGSSAPASAPASSAPASAPASPSPATSS